MGHSRTGFPTAGSTTSTGSVFHEALIEGGKHWSLTVRSGTALRLIDVKGGANVGMLFYNPYNLLERYNAPDTLKCQHTFKLTKGHCLYSDMGRCRRQQFPSNPSHREQTVQIS